MCFIDSVRIDSLRPPLSHLVYLEGDPSTGRYYGLVQFFGTIQLYAPLSRNYRGEPFAVKGYLDPVARTEQFEGLDALRLHEPPRIVTDPDSIPGWSRRLNDQVKARFGVNQPYLRP